MDLEEMKALIGQYAVQKYRLGRESIIFQGKITSTLEMDTEFLAERIIAELERLYVIETTGKQD